MGQKLCFSSEKYRVKLCMLFVNTCEFVIGRDNLSIEGQRLFEEKHYVRGGW